MKSFLLASIVISCFLFADVFTDKALAQCQGGSCGLRAANGPVAGVVSVALNAGGRLIQWRPKGRLIQWRPKGRLIQWRPRGRLIQWRPGVIFR